MNDFEIIRDIITQGKQKALISANYYFLEVYWQIGGFISYKLKTGNWGEKIVENLAEWLKNVEPALKGFSRRDLYRMKEFYEIWSSDSINDLCRKMISSNILTLTQYIDKIAVKNVGSVTPQFNEDVSDVVGSEIPQLIQIPGYLAKISWTHHIELIRSAKKDEEKVFYLGLTIKENYTVRELRRQISSGLFERQILSKQNLVVEHPQKEKFKTIFKDTYVTEFLELPEPYSESDLQRELIAKMQKFILELGRDFIFINKEYKIQVGMHDYYIDLLFFHRELQCLVAFELKIDSFKPEYLGKLQFYLEALDRDVKKQNENPSIGVLLCKTHDSEVVEYAMSRNMSPAMIAKYETTLPDKIYLQNKVRELLES